MCPAWKAISRVGISRALLPASMCSTAPLRGFFLQFNAHLASKLPLYNPQNQPWRDTTISVPTLWNSPNQTFLWLRWCAPSLLFLFIIFIFLLFSCKTFSLMCQECCINKMASYCGYLEGKVQRSILKHRAPWIIKANKSWVSCSFLCIRVDSRDAGARAACRAGEGGHGCPGDASLQRRQIWDRDHLLHPGLRQRAGRNAFTPVACVGAGLYEAGKMWLAVSCHRWCLIVWSQSYTRWLSLCLSHCKWEYETLHLPHKYYHDPVCTKKRHLARVCLSSSLELIPLCHECSFIWLELISEHNKQQIYHFLDLHWLWISS